MEFENVVSAVSKVLGAEQVEAMGGMSRAIEACQFPSDEALKEVVNLVKDARFVRLAPYSSHTAISRSFE